MKVLLAFLCCTQFAFAANKPVPKSEPMVAAPQPKLSDYYSPDDSSAIIAKWASGKRKPAAAGMNYGEKDMSDSSKMIRSRILSAKSADEVDALMTDLEAKYDGLADDAKFFAAQILLLKPLRGIVWRLRPLFEQTDGHFDFFSGNRTTQSAAVGILRMIYQTTHIYVPTEQSEILFKYVVTPSASMRLAQQFKTMSSFQNFLRTDMYTALDTAAKRLLILGKNSATYVLDSQTFYGKGTFDDGIVRYVGYGDAEVALTKAAIQGAMQSILVFFAYNQDQLMNVIGRVGKLYGVDGFSSEKLGVTSKERVAVLESFRSRGFLALKKTEQNPKLGADYMRAAYTHLEAHIANLKDAYEILQAQQPNNASVLNPLFFKADAQPRLSAGVITMNSIVRGATTIRSPITGEVLTVNVPAFYENPPEQMLDLLPRSFKASPAHEESLVNTAGETLVYRDYSEGRPTGWGPEWTKIFPSLSQTQNVADAFRVIQYTSGAGVIFGPMSYFIF